MRYLSHCRFRWRGPAWWLANLLPLNFTTLPQKSSNVGAGRLDPGLQILGYVIGKSIKDNKRLGYIKQRFNLRMHVQIKGLNRTSPSNWAYTVISMISNEFKDVRQRNRESSKKTDTLAPNVPEINSNFCFFRPGPCACPDPCRGTESTWNLYVTPKTRNQWKNKWKTERWKEGGGNHTCSASI